MTGIERVGVRRRESIRVEMSVCVAGVERVGCKRIERTCVLW